MEQRYWKRTVLWSAAGLWMLAAGHTAGLAAETEKAPLPVKISLSAGMINYEGDEAVHDAFLTSLQLGLDLSEMWALEGVVDVAPVLNQTFRTEWGTWKRISRLEEDAGVDKTYSAGFALDALFHFIGRRTVDPYLAAGAGLLYYGDTFDNQGPVRARAGGGIFFRVSEQWRIRADARVLAGLCGEQEFNLITTLGLCWSPAAWKAARPTLVIPATPVGPSVATESTAAAKEFKPYVPPTDDVQMFRLDMNIAEDGHWHPEYYSELDAIAKAIQAYPGSDVWIEGYMDQRPAITEQDARKLTEKQAEAVRDYFIKTHKIAGKRLIATGYGFARAKAPNDPVNGNPENRRMEIHIRPLRTTP